MRCVTFATSEIAFPGNWMADVYARNYVATESVASRCYYLIRVGIVFSIFQSRCRRKLSGNIARTNGCLKI